ncbi:hypothetical protein AK830_g2034 [Neonectria ditissima]|uniref:Alpha/beta hydrolase fold-3 domain-containing protein n=1 Tax=Neonectria ditissima TaxID=78410 RepID=A0A0P7B4L4_9HYPO|nr:hypothetical protein AK830_g2034 [Neonectria ditissima]
MASFLLSSLDGYKAKTLTFKSIGDGDIKLDVVYPEKIDDASPSTVLLHYHGGFLIFGDRYSFIPHWLVNACASRKWIFVTPDYRLIPETTAQSSLEDAVDAYEWVLESLPRELGCKVGSVLVAGSSAGGYLALATAAAVTKQPSALLLIYGMLDATYSTYTTPGDNIFGQPVFDTSSLLAEFPIASLDDKRPVLSGYQFHEEPRDNRVELASALHIDGLFLDYMTGVKGLGRAVVKEGAEAIPQHLKNLFPLAFGNLAKLPSTMLIHGKNDSGVPVELSIQAAEKIRAAGVRVLTEFPDDGEHGFDVNPGNVDVEKASGENVTAFQSLRNAIDFLQSISQGKS